MQNEKGQYVDLYVPRRCFATNKLLDSKDNASVQISITDVNIVINSRLDLTETPRSL